MTTTNIDKIYKNRDEALERLDNLECGFGETILIRYYSDSNPVLCDCSCSTPSKKFVNIIQALYKSDKVGDYVIILDSGKKEHSIVYQGIINEGESLKEAINRALFGDRPKDGNILVLTNPKTKAVQSYIYSNREWVCLGNIDTKDIFYPNPNQFEVDETGLFNIKTVWGGTFGE